MMQTKVNQDDIRSFCNSVTPQDVTKHLKVQRKNCIRLDELCMHSKSFLVVNHNHRVLPYMGKEKDIL